MTDSDEPLEIVRGSGNIFNDFGDAHPEAEHFRAILAAQVIKSLDAQGLTVRKAQQLTGVDASEFSRIRNVKLERFTIDQLIAVLNSLGEEVDLEVTFRSRHKPHSAPRRTPPAGRSEAAKI